MATPTSLSLPNFISFFFPSKSPPPPKLAPTQLSAPSSPIQFQSQTLSSVDGLAHSSSDLSSVIFPSLAYSNTLYARSRPFNVQMVVEGDESEDDLVIRFRRDVMRSGIMHEVRRRMFHENKQEEKKRRILDGHRRNRQRRPFNREEEDAANLKKRDDYNEDDDNWELPEGEELLD